MSDFYNNPFTGQSDGKSNGHGNGHHFNGLNGNGHAGDPNLDEIVCEQFRPIPRTSMRPRPWAYGHYLLFGHAAVLGALDGGGKGAMAVVIALAMITGRALLGEHVWRDGPVAIISYEDDQDEWHRRIHVACLRYGIDYETIISSFYFLSQPHGRIRLTPIAAVGDNAAIIAHLKTIGAAVLIVDPFNHAAATDEPNNNLLIAQLAGEMDRIAAESRAAVLVLHHLRKGATGSIDDLMGATALRATFRSGRILRRMTAAEAEELNIESEEAWRYIRISSTKENYAPPADRATWYRFESIDLGNVDVDPIYPKGDNVQVLAPWQPRPPELSKTAIAAIFAKLREGPEAGEFYSPDVRAKWWVGEVIKDCSGWAADEPAERLLNSWLKNQVLQQDRYHSNVRHRRIHRVTLNEVMARDILGTLYQPPAGA